MVILPLQCSLFALISELEIVALMHLCSIKQFGMPLVESVDDQPMGLLTTTPFRSSLVSSIAGSLSLCCAFQLIESFMVECNPPLDRNLLTIPLLVVNLLILLLGAVRAAASWVLLLVLA